MKTYILSVLLVVLATNMTAQTVNESLVWQKVEEARRKHRAQQGERDIDAQKIRIEQHVQELKERNRQYVENQYEYHEELYQNIQDASSWSAEDVKGRHSFMKGDNYSHARLMPKSHAVSPSNQIYGHKTDFAAFLDKIEVGAPETFIPREQLSMMMHRRYFASSSFTDQKEEQTRSLLRSAVDFIDMDYVDYLNSDRRSLVEDVARKFYRDVKEVTVDISQMLGQKWDSVIGFLNCDFGELCEQGRLSVRAKVIKETLPVSMRATGNINQSMRNVTGKINTSIFTFESEKAIFASLFDGTFASQSVNAAATGNTRDVDMRGQRISNDVSRLAKTVVENETGMKVTPIPANAAEGWRQALKGVGLETPESMVRKKVSNSLYGSLKEAMPTEIETYESIQKLLK